MKQYIVDAFTDTVFKGNQAAICVLENWISEQTMMNITLENNFSETAFMVKKGKIYELRWFTPGGEIDLCGHATLAAAYVIMRFVEPDQTTTDFQTKSGLLTVEKNNNLYEMDMPAYELRQVPVTDEMENAIGVRPLEAWMGRDLVCVLENEKQVRNVMPNQEMIKGLDGLLLHVTATGKEFDCVSRTFAPKMGVTDEMENAIGVRPLEAWMGRDLVCVLENEKQVRNVMPNQEMIKGLDGLLLHVTATGKEFDCVSRTFAPKMGVTEDAVCGSGHCHIVPLWAEKLNKQEICAFQASPREGVLHCKMNGSRVRIAGNAALYSIAELYL